MLNFKEFIIESSDQPYPFELTYQRESHYEYSFRLADGRGGIVSFADFNALAGIRSTHDDSIWTIEFAIDDRQGKTGKGDAFRIIATVIATIVDFVKRKKTVNRFELTALRDGKNPESRIKLYRALLNKFSKDHHYQIEEYDNGDAVIFGVTRG